MTSPVAASSMTMAARWQYSTLAAAGPRDGTLAEVSMGKPLNNRQRVKNPWKRERFVAPQKNVAAQPDGWRRRKHVERLLKGPNRER